METQWSTIKKLLKAWKRKIKKDLNLVSCFAFILIAPCRCFQNIILQNLKIYELSHTFSVIHIFAVALVFLSFYFLVLMFKSQDEHRLALYLPGQSKFAFLLNQFSRIN